jgi:hypothetical protein
MKVDEQVVYIINQLIMQEQGNLSGIRIDWIVHYRIESFHERRHSVASNCATYWAQLCRTLDFARLNVRRSQKHETNGAGAANRQPRQLVCAPYATSASPNLPQDDNQILVALILRSIIMCNVDLKMLLCHYKSYTLECGLTNVPFSQSHFESWKFFSTVCLPMS